MRRPKDDFFFEVGLPVEDASAFSVEEAVKPKLRRRWWLTTLVAWGVLFLGGLLLSWWLDIPGGAVMSFSAWSTLLQVNSTQQQTKALWTDLRQEEGWVSHFSMASPEALLMQQQVNGLTMTLDNSMKASLPGDVMARHFVQRAMVLMRSTIAMEQAMLNPNQAWTTARRRTFLASSRYWLRQTDVLLRQEKLYVREGLYLSS